MHRLFVVEDVFEVKRRGVVAIGPLDDPDKGRYEIGDTVEIRRAGAVVARTVISGITMRPVPPKGTAEVLLRAISKAEVGPGDEVWLCAGNRAAPGTSPE
jgi:translation elongation factor EF-Tu-like GTPase